MIRMEVTSMVTVFRVHDLDKALEWYQKWLGSPDVLPMEGIAEFQMGSNAWLQLSSDENESFEKSALILGVEDIMQSHQKLSAAGLKVGEIIDYEVVLAFDIYDVDGNRISFVQEL